MRLIKFLTLDDLNVYLKLAKNVKKVKLLTEGNLFRLTTVYYALIDDTNEYQNGK